MTEMRILTVRQPWASAIIHLGKNVENRRKNLAGGWTGPIAIIRPAVVVWENVRGAYSACAESEIDSDLGRCPRCADPASGADHAPNLRALGRVLGDLDGLGFDAEWIGLRAYDAGAPHERFRVFVVANRRGETGEFWPRFVAAGSEEVGRGRPGDGDVAASGPALRFPTPRDSLLPTPRATRGASSTEIMYALGGERDDEGDEQGNVTLEPAFATTSVEEYEALWASLEDQSPYWVTAEGKDYWPAIQRWGQILGRPAPAPTLPNGKDGNHRLSARLPEWMMGQADGWITSPEIGLTRNQQLRAAGNGVVTQQAVLALHIAWRRILEAVAA